jgi:hypothetical protein
VIGAISHLVPPCSLGLSATSQQYFSLTTNQSPATSQQYFSLRTNQHQPSATSQTNRPTFGVALTTRRTGRRGLSKALVGLYCTYVLCSCTACMVAICQLLGWQWAQESETRHHIACWLPLRNCCKLLEYTSCFLFDLASYVFQNG